MVVKEFLNTDRLSLKVGKALSHLPITPNQWTLLSLVPALIAFYFVFLGNPLLGAGLFLLSAIVDGFDGGLARYTGKSTPLGAFLDGNTDRFVDFLMVYSFLFLGLPTLWLPPEHWVVIMVFVGIMPSFTVAYANHRGAVKDPKETVVWRILNRPEMFILWVIVLATATFDTQIALYVLILTVFLSLLTTIQTKILAVVKSRSQKSISIRRF